LFKARDFFDKEPFLVYNADIVTDLDLKEMYDFHLSKKGIATIAGRHRKGNRFFLMDESGILRGWRNKATGEELIVTRVPHLYEIGFLGIHVIDPEIFDYMEEGVYSMTKLYLSIAARHNIFSYVYDEGYWGDIGTPESLENARLISRGR
jgi:NDP-sugar pyrophosphorylase family protein